MTWVVWRQYRLQWAIALALLAAFAVVELLTGQQLARAWHNLLTTCTATPQNGPGSSCSNAQIIGILGNDMRVLSILAPLILGVLWGAPLVAHEIEAGTTNFAWTQGITRSHWLLVKVGWLLLSAALWAGAVSALVTWWSGPVNAMQGDAFGTNFFDTQGIVPISYAVFATALGIAAGLLLRRTLPAIAVTIGGFIGVRLFFDTVVRQHLMPAVTTITGLTSSWSPPGIAWILGTTIINGSGQVATGSAAGTSITSLGIDGVSVSALPAACQKLAIAAASPSGPSPAGALACMSRYGFRQVIAYQPAWRYWPFQGIETGVYLLLAVALLAIAWFAVRGRDA
jgi:ABC-type transport system involved in multi-copper enzyme maturation permease subunit